MYEQLQSLPYGIVVINVADGNPVYANVPALETIGVTDISAMGHWSIACRPEVVDPPLFDAVAIVDQGDRPRVRLQGTWTPLPLTNKSGNDALALFVMHLTPIIHPWRQMLKEITENVTNPTAPAENIMPPAEAQPAPPDERVMWERARFAALDFAVSQGPKAVLLWDAESGVINYVSENLAEWGITLPVYMDEWVKLVHSDDLPELSGGRARLVKPDADITVWSYRIQGNNGETLTLGERSRRIASPDGIALVCTVLENRTLPHIRRSLDPLLDNRRNIDPLLDSLKDKLPSRDGF